ncbi:MAG: cobalt ECF transporter T component CbiQ [Lachnospiraceae bacterium]|nr:cobalt ECF transporter T component CbiQ [Lachnospiraceae bacterium]
MSDIYKSAAEFREMDELTEMSSPIHNIHPLAKLVVTIVFIFTTASFSKYDFSGLIIMIIYPALMFSFARIPVRLCFYKLRWILPLILAVGIFNPIFDRTPVMRLGSIIVSGGVVSMITLMIKGILCIMASFILAATTSMDAICAALRKLHIPGMLVTLLLLTYRYISLMLDEVSVMTTAYRLRAPGQKGIHISAWGSFLGQILLRSMDRAQELYANMLLRGFKGEFGYAPVKKAAAGDIIFFFVTIVLIVLARMYNVAGMIGGIAMKMAGFN